MDMLDILTIDDTYEHLLGNNKTRTPQGVDEILAPAALELPGLIAHGIGKLIKAGATNILVMLLPLWDQTPLVNGLKLDAGLRQLLSQFNTVLNTDIISNVSAVAPLSINLKFFDVVGATCRPPTINF